MPKAIQGVFVAVILLALGAGGMRLMQDVEKHVPADRSAKIVGPASVEYAGQYAAFQAVVPGKDPAMLIYTWGVEPQCPIAANQPLPSCRSTGKPGEVQLDTVAGRWRLSVAVSERFAKTGQMVSIDVSVPGGQRPFVPTPAPSPAPNPQPQPLPQPDPTPVGRFAQFTVDVRAWLSEVQSPDKIAEASVIATGATEVAASLRTGSLSKLSGLPLRIAVASEVLRNNNKVHNAAGWSAFGARVNAAAGAAVKAGQLNSAGDWAEFLQAFSDGLK
ncbi:MAG: hypothetical protein WCH39_10280 [Schlesneria sp.]